MNSKWHKLMGVVLLALTVMPAQAFYNPTTGRWLSRDPIEERGGFNVYGLLENAPVDRIDKTGLQSLGSGLDQTLTFFADAVEARDCGEFRYRITWSLNLNKGQADSVNGGAIVQLVEAAFGVTWCDEEESPYHFGPPSRNPVIPNDWPFYEAWRIPPGKSRPALTRFHDFWQMPNFGEGTKGSITIIGTADYFDGMDIPWYFTPGTAGPPHNELPTSHFFFPPTAPTSTIKRTLIATWNCCCGSRDKKTKVTVPDDSFPK